MIPPFLTTGEVAAAYGVSIPTVKRWIRDKYLKAARTTGGHCRISRTELLRFQAAHAGPAVEEGPPRILVVDDDPYVLSSLVDALGLEQRYTVETAADGYEGLVKVGAFKPSILILDVAMPLLNGLEVCRRLKANPETQGIRILGLTGYPDRIPALLEAGADACLTKPVNLRQLRQELERVPPAAGVLRPMMTSASSAPDH